MPSAPLEPISAKQEFAPSRLLGPGVVIGFTSAVTMWLVWYPLHLPGLRVSAQIAGPLLLLVLLASIARGTRGLGPAAVKVGLAAGLVSALVNLLLLGNQLTEAGANPEDAANAQFRPSAALIAGGFVVLSLVAGLVGGLIGGRIGKGKPIATDWLAQFGVVAVAAMLPLVAAGGAVTSAGAGMAVPDWPGTYGANMFLYPIGLMADPRIYLEHTHRLFGTLVGLTTLALMIAVLVSKRGTLSKALAVVVFIGVCVQGILGAIRVTDINPGFGIIHGVLAQLILCAAAILAVSLTQTWRERLAVDTALARKTRVWTDLAIAGLLIQLILGAMYRHQDSGHAIMTHMGFAVIAAALVLMAAFGLIRLSRDSGGNRTLKKIGTFLMHGVSLQVALGLVAFLLLGAKGGGETRVVMPDQLREAPEIPLAGVIVATAHQVIGAGLLMTAALGSVWVRRARSEIPTQTIQEG